MPFTIKSRYEIPYPDDEKVLHGGNYKIAVSRQGPAEILT